MAYFHSVVQNATFCLNNELYSRTPANSLNLILRRFVYPFLSIFGISGNSLIVSVLALGSPNRANDLLAMLALADMTVLVLNVPHFMSAYPIIGKNLTFLRVYSRIKTFLQPLTNWNCAIAMW